ncbi:MAG: 30S ribosomal protein S9 [Nanoarchaeota archaeon]|nr:30S ribosomal protein S9 [Nanoarchaeota archaeon]
MSKNIIIKSGKRKSAIAKATLREGTGKVTVNKVPIDAYVPFLYKARIQEPLLLAGEELAKVDIEVSVNGGGPMGQSDAARLAIAKALAEHDPKLKAVFLNYDRKLLVADVRLKETHKPNKHGGARGKKQKSYR